MEKRARFESRWLPYALIAPQMAVTLIFFFWPASQAIYQSFFVQDAFGASTQFVWFENFSDLFRNEDYLASFKITAVFSLLVAALGLSISLVLAVLADWAIRGATVYKTLLIWPYAVAPAVAAVWRQISYNFLFFLAGLQSIPKSLIEAAAIDGAGPIKRFATIVFPLLSPTTFFLLVVNIVYAFFDTFGIIDAATSGGPGKATEILVYKVYSDGFKGLDLGSSYAQSVVLMMIVIGLTVAQFRYVERKVQY